MTPLSILSVTPVADEWANLEVMFSWEAGVENTATGSGMVYVSFNPASDDEGDTFSDSKLPRFVESSAALEVVKVGDCTTTLLFPYVTNEAGFDTGVIIVNTSDEDGSCTIDFYRDGEVQESITSDVGGQAHDPFLVSVEAPDFGGYITATCGFRKARGFAFITDGFGGVGTLAQGYLAECTGQCE